jgi:transcription elongation factor Elf1
VIIRFEHSIFWRENSKKMSSLTNTSSSLLSEIKHELAAAPAKHCPVCGLQIVKTSTGITVNGVSYHSKCISTITCGNCGEKLDYLVRGRLDESRLMRVYCSTCGKEF